MERKSERLYFFDNLRWVVIILAALCTLMSHTVVQEFGIIWNREKQAWKDSYLECMDPGPRHILWDCFFYRRLFCTPLF